MTIKMSETKVPAILISVQSEKAHVDWLIGIVRDLETGGWEGHYRFRHDDDNSTWSHIIPKKPLSTAEAITHARTIAAALADAIELKTGTPPSVRETEFPLDADLKTILKIFKECGHFWVGEGKNEGEAMRNKEAQKAFDRCDAGVRQ
jgi:hypothetical protein